MSEPEQTQSQTIGRPWLHQYHWTRETALAANLKAQEARRLNKAKREQIAQGPCVKRAIVLEQIQRVRRAMSKDKISPGAYAQWVKALEGLLDIIPDSPAVCGKLGH